MTPAAARRPHHAALDAWIGRWINDGGRVQTVLHERTDDGTMYRTWSRVTLVKVSGRAATAHAMVTRTGRPTGPLSSSAADRSRSTVTL